MTRQALHLAKARSFFLASLDCHETVIPGIGKPVNYVPELAQRFTTARHGSAKLGEPGRKVPGPSTKMVEIALDDAFDPGQAGIDLLFWRQRAEVADNRVKRLDGASCER